MNTKLIVGIAAAVVVVAGAVYFFAGSKAPATEGVQEQAAVASSDAGKKMAFADFIKQGGSYKCTVHQSVGGIDTVGTTYISGDMIRGEYTTQVQGQNIDTSFVLRDGYTYSWSSMVPNMGIKSKAVVAAGDTSASAQGSYSFNAEQIGDYQCDPWTADASTFALPKGVTFREY